jgi:hypothetical protein
MEQLLAYRAELLDRLARQPSEFVETLAAAPGAEWARRRVPGGDTLHRAVAHVRDLETLAFLPRLRRILTEGDPAFEAFPTHRWSMERYRPDEPMTALLEDFARAREEALGLLRGLAPDGWSRLGFHPPSGKRTAQWWAERMYLHAHEHLAEIRQALKT